MKTKLFVGLISIIAGLSVKAQDRVRQLQISTQASRPISTLLTVSKFGYGGSLKGIYGFNDDNHQLSFEAGYHRFPLANVPAGINMHYSAVPIYAGYRYPIKRFFFEPQIGLSVNRIDGTNGKVSASSTFYNLAWAIGACYVIKNIEFGIRGQISEIKGKEEDLNFLGIRFAYNINL